MKNNMSKSDRYVRAILAVLIGVFIFLNILKGPAAFALGVIAIVLLLTSLFGFCPAYTILGISTKK